MEDFRACKLVLSSAQTPLTTVAGAFQAANATMISCIVCPCFILTRGRAAPSNTKSGTTLIERLEAHYLGNSRQDDPRTWSRHGNV